MLFVGRSGEGTAGAGEASCAPLQLPRVIESDVSHQLPILGVPFAPLCFTFLYKY
jgi:hypothetical protein